MLQYPKLKNFRTKQAVVDLCSTTEAQLVNNPKSTLMTFHTFYTQLNLSLIYVSLIYVSNSKKYIDFKVNLSS